MKNFIIGLVLIWSVPNIFGQGNCNMYPEDSGERKACELSYKALEYSQGSEDSQLMFDSAIAIGPNYAWAYYEKSVPYFKRGFFQEGIQLLNEAVKIEPLEYTCNRAYWYWQYKNYKLCIRDLESYFALPNAFNQFEPGGEKSMKVFLSMSYAKIHNLPKSIEILKSLVDSYKSDAEIGFTDYHTLGMLYVFNNENDKAIEAFKKQFTIIDDFPDSYYYLGLAYKNKSDFNEAKLQFNKALSVAEDVNRYYSINPGFPVTRSDVRRELNSLQ